MMKRQEGIRCRKREEAEGEGKGKGAEEGRLT